MRVLSEQPNKKSYQDGNLRLKVFGASFKKSDILNEALNQARVEETGLQIPKLLEVKQIDGQWTIVTEFIEGETLESLMAAHPEKMSEYLEQFVALQSDILSKTCTAAEPPERQDEPEDSGIRSGCNHTL